MPGLSKTTIFVNMISHSLFNILVLSWIGVALILFPIQFFITAPYGRHSKKSWGRLIDNRIGWITMELPSLAIMVYFFIAAAGSYNAIIVIGFTLWILHYINRVIIFPFRLKTSGKKMPVVIMLFAFVFNLFNGSFNGYWLAYLAPDLTSAWYLNLRILAGIVLFITGFILNLYHDQILLKLRKNKNTGYQIPFGGLFKYVSCPNFLGEIIEWAGFALLVWGLPALSFLVWAVVNLIPRALDHHKWYKQHFEDYPKERKAILPFLF